VRGPTIADVTPVATKRGLAAALNSGDPAFDSLPAYFESRLLPALGTLLQAAAAAGEARADVAPNDRPASEITLVAVARQAETKL
jgi:hypothetical protein